MGIAILPGWAVKHSVASVVTCDIVGDLPMSEIALVSDKRVRTPVLDNFRAFTLEKGLGATVFLRACLAGMVVATAWS